MARMKKENLEAKIKKAEERVVRTGETYNAACEEWKNLRDKMTAFHVPILHDSIDSSFIIKEQMPH